MAASPVEGLTEFRRHMRGVEGSYALIGGIACDILLSDADLPFRATHDFDTVLIVDGKLHETAQAIWSLIHDGGYRCGWGSAEKVCFYRFTDPDVPDYPRMIEVFSRKPSFLKNAGELEIAPLHIDEEISSLSAIVLDDFYYELLLHGTKVVNGLSVLSETYLIPFKAKAYLDLRARKQQGEQVDTKKIQKHKRDVFRLAQLLSGNERVSLPDSVTGDMDAFLSTCASEPVDTKQIGIPSISMDEMIAVLLSVYGITA